VDAFRYYLALVFVISITPALGMWFIVHPLVHFWRRIGPLATYTVVLALLGAGIYGMFLVRRPILAVEFGTSVPLSALGVALLVVATLLRARIQRRVGARILSGLPELAPERYPTTLVTEGIYARIRHPRYVQFMIAFLGWALLANYLCLYVLWLVWIPAIYLIVLLEERELRDRFGSEYEAYGRRVPRFVPRLGA
jgi:protein-S-isoprenylcysteine O-methyltransferase Ste14